MATIARTTERRITMQNEMRDRLVELLGNRCCSKQIPCEICEYQNFGDCHKYALADHLIENGVIVPPCKVGDTVYVVSQGNGFTMRWDVYEGTVVDIHLNRHNKLTIRVENGERFFGYYEPRFIHNTKEEAEKALKEGADNR